jgi:hypothetical protein
MEPQEWGVSTQKEGRIFLHVLSPGAPEEITLPDSSGWEVRRAVLFDGGTEVKYRKVGADGDISISLPEKYRNPVDTIVVLER